MIIKQFEYNPLAHYSYAIVSNGEMAIIDPERDPIQYYNFAKEQEAVITAVIETHPHADFISSHLQIHKETGATIYNSEKLGAEYTHQTFDEGDELNIGNARLRAINTPGHSPDSITIVAEERDKTVLFTGDTLFIGDVGRPDLREKAGNMKAKRRELAEAMYHTIQEKFKDLPDDAIVYPAHGAGSLCGKNMSDDSSSTLGNERMGNWAFQDQSKEDFINTLLDSQPFIPSYFGYDVDLNKAGAPSLRDAMAAVPFKINESVSKGIIIDVRDESKFKAHHLPGSINIQAVSENSKFETWLGAIVKPKEEFHIVVESPTDMVPVLERVCKIGYEQQLSSIVTLPYKSMVATDSLDLTDFKKNPDQYTIVDIRNASEVEEGKFFENALSYPLNTLRDTVDEIPRDKPIVVHCAGGYRSAAGSSILAKELDQDVYDLGEAVNEFK
ncbi:MBL fold metallo-hydrolase [Zeaxanthinibacter sp. PT1]|uniref:MBL fold metallo-hydrolase n=1 Tax=Zeaxanthinibacter TaxID=561554 RepID=UPI00234ADCCF|nr:MBL fold metallo-hydrolase [Zeaxanthinibacter sp. PT1]MDC6351370.1 MBL fold metallo-hydrolase [Zeaxanthinibacter sp. PT1]